MPLGTFIKDYPPTTLRGLAFLALTDTATLYSQQSTSDGGGGATQSWSAYLTGVPCRIAPLTNRPFSRVVAERVSEYSTHVLTVPADVTVGLTDRVEIDGRGTFNVTGVRERTGQVTTVVEVTHV